MKTSHARKISNRANWRPLLCVIGVLIWMTSCVRMGPLHKYYNEVLDNLEQADIDHWALECAPSELALAQAHREFAELEFEQGDARRAEYHLLLARENAVVAVQKADACRPKDRDGDGIMDPDDACPDDPEDLDNWQDEDGCPDADNDGDGILDVVDQCPNDPELPNGYMDHDGCPDSIPDRDGDGLVDTVDQCPDEPENYNDYLDDDGCPDVKPQNVTITKKQIQIHEQINFQVNKARILPSSYHILDSVAQVLKDYPDIRIRIEGHTDSDGPDSYNMKLSNKRAASVLKYLTEHGVSTSRLESIGYGETRPLDTNRTSAGKAKNRRVEFHIIDGM